VAGTVHSRLKEALKKLGITQQELAEKIGFAQSHISRIMNGVNIPNSRFYDILSHELYLNPVWLQKGTGEMFITKSDFSPRETSIIAKYRLLTSEEKAVIDKMADLLLKKKEEK
jgi:transcriptional regulator with XRE-family HTH domain